MFIDSIDDKIIIKLNNFDIENTEIEFGENFHIDILQLPKFYENKNDNLTLFNIRKKLKGEIQYI